MTYKFENTLFYVFGAALRDGVVKILNCNRPNIHLMGREAPPQTVINDRFEIFSDHETFFFLIVKGIRKVLSYQKKNRFFKSCMV